MPDFWNAVLIAIFVVPMIVLFGYAVFDVVQRHEIGVAVKALLLIAFCLFPIVGPLVYLVIRPPGSRDMEERLAGDENSRTQELLSLSSLHDQGKLTDEEFRKVKEQSIYGAAEPGSVREQRRGQLL